jgi:Xaa-Pro aminopeptidase
MPGTEWTESGDLVLEMRTVKSASEVAAIEASARLNDAVYEKALAAARPGATEIDIRNAIRAEADRSGADGESFDCIVASGATASRPHYVPADRPLRRGELLLIDMGMKVGGYCSDMTRVVALGARPKARLMRAFEAVLEAEKAALDEVGPGAATSDLYRIAHDRLKRRRLARFFTHGLGHGIGLEVHESPRMTATSPERLKPGMVVTIEPGVYLPGVGGVRIEDLVAVTRGGRRVLSRAVKSFRTIPFD